jgi:hypothetical protein
MVGTEDDWYCALGDTNAKGDSTMFYRFGQDSCWEPQYLIPAAVARDESTYF